MSDNEFENEPEEDEKDKGFEEEEEEDDDEEEEELEEELSEFGDSVVDEPALEPVENEEEDNPYKIKFDAENKKSYLQEYHPEEIHKPFEEVYKLSLITRDEQTGIIIDDLHKTYPILSKYERTKVLGLRVSQLNKGAKPYVTLNNTIIDNILIAEKELKEKKIPFIIMRPIPNSNSEYWNVNDLEDL